MSRYSINTFEKLSGIKAHTIRIWEHRYQIFVPKRTKTNIRCYDDEQLKKLLNIATLLNNGARISKLSLLSDTELAERAARISEQTPQTDIAIEALINKLVSAGLRLDNHAFENVYASIQKRFDLEESYPKIIQPMLFKIGLMWRKSKMIPAQEHFLSHLVRQKIMVAIDSLVQNEEVTDEKWLLFLPQDEYHEIPLLFAYFLLKKHGKKVIYLGANVPIKNIEINAESSKPTHSLSFIYKKTKPEACMKQLEAIQKALPNSKILISGLSDFLDKVDTGERIIRINNVPNFIETYL